MKRYTRSLLAAALSALIALPGAAMADRHGHGERDYGYRGDRHSFGRHYDRHDFRGYDERPITRYYREDDGGDLLLGLVVGGLLGYAINNAQQNAGTYDSYSRAYPNSYATTQDFSYNNATNASCLQTREYTTTVRVGGRNVDAYGTACLQPDGSWSRGPAQLVNY